MSQFVKKRHREKQCFDWNRLNASVTAITVKKIENGQGNHEHRIDQGNDGASKCNDKYDCLVHERSLKESHDNKKIHSLHAFRTFDDDQEQHQHGNIVERAENG